MRRTFSRLVAAPFARTRPIRTRAKSPLDLQQLECREQPAYTGIGTGLVGDYFGDPALANLAFTRTDAGLDANWGLGSPGAATPADGFSARWTGKVQAQVTEPYTFSVATSDGVRLWVGGKLLIDAWTNQAATEFSGTASLTAGEAYDVKLEYVDQSGPAAVKLSWASPSTPKAAIPASQLYPAGGWLDRDLGTVAGTSLVGSNGTLTLGGAGAIGGTTDQGHFAYQSLTGDGAVVAKLTSLTGGQGGLMIRAATDSDAAFAAVGVSGNQVIFQSRGTAGAAATQTGVAGSSPAWLKLVRNGPLVSGYVSATGADGSWQLVGTAPVALGTAALAGLAVGSTGPAQTATFANVAVTPVVPVGANLDAVNDWSLQNAFVDIFKQSRAFTALNHPGAPTTDANGWPTEDFQTYVQTGALKLAHVLNGTYKLSFTGKATVGLSITAGTLTNVVYNAATNTTTADVNLNASDSDGGWYLVLQFRNPANGFGNVKLIRPGYAANTTQVFTDQFLAQIKDFTTLRFMDWTQTNNNPVVNWADRTKPTDALQSGPKGAAWEYAVQLANQTGKDLWVNVPIGATDDYVTQLATFLKSTLNPDRAVYVEFSNEVWNGQFSQTIANLNAAVAEVKAGLQGGPASNLFYPGETALNGDGTYQSQWDWAFRRIARRDVEISNLFRAVWGDAAMNTRVRVTLASQAAAPYVVKTQLEFVDKVYGAPSQYVYAAASAPYFFLGAADQQPLTADQVIAALTAAIPANTANEQEFAHWATYYGVRNVSYEGGPDTFGSNNIAAKKAAMLDPRMQGVIAAYLTDWYANGGGLFNWFVAGPTSYDTAFGTWGLTNDVTVLNSPKQLGIEQVMAGGPVAPVVGAAVSGEVLAKNFTGAQPTADPYPRYLHTGDTRDYTVRSPQAGTYSLKVRYAQVDPGGRLEVLVNGRSVAVLDLPVTGPGFDSLWAPNDFADSVAVGVPLEQGLNVIRLRVVQEGYTLYSLKFDAPNGVTVPPPPVVPPPPPPASPPPPPAVNQPPSVTASAPASVGGTTAALTATGSDDGGAANLTYTWTVLTAPAGAPAVTFSANGTTAAAASTATFGRAGAYTFRVTATDAGGLTATATAVVTVNPTLTALTVTPGTLAVTVGATQTFVASPTDQFGKPMTAAVSWSLAGAGTLTATGFYTAPAASGAATVTAAAGGLSKSAAVTVTAAAAPAVNYATGFTGATLRRNGSAMISGSRLRLTAAANQTGSAFTSQPVNVSTFTSRFRFQLGSLDGSPWSLGDGMTFVLQAERPTALGAGGSGLGYAGIAKSVAIKLDLVNNIGEGANSTGIYTGGASPTNPATDLTPGGLDLHSGHVFQADLAYDGTMLNVTLTDTQTGLSATQHYLVNLTAALGGATAYAGFTAGTGALAGTLDVLSWTLTGAASSPSATGPTLAGLTKNGSATMSGSSLRLTNTTNQAGSAFTAQRVAVNRVTTSFNFAIGSLDGSPWSVGDGLTFALQTQAATALGTGGSGLGLAGIAPAVAVKFDVLANNLVVTVNGTDAVLNLDAPGLDLHSGHTFRADVSYDGATLTAKLTDTATSASAALSVAVNLGSALGATTAFAGFTGGTGILAADLDVSNWAFASS